jgi:hypothetical protein
VTDTLIIKGQLLSRKSDAFISEVGSEVIAALTRSKASASFREIYRLSLAAESVLPVLVSRKLRPSISAIRNTSRRIPVLISMGQESLAKVELRRLMELVFWTVYFTHHPREWEHFDGKKLIGFTRDVSKPIGYAAHRDLNFYLQYAMEYMEAETSGEALKAIQDLDGAKKELNAAVHAGQIARTPNRQLPFDAIEEPNLVAFARILKRVLGSSLVVLMAFDKASFQKIPAGPRAYFDWLIGAQRSRAIRSKQFGLDINSPFDS